MLFCIYYIQDFFMRAINFKNKNFKYQNLSKVLFTQGMVCHETYKDKNNNWLSPDDIETKDGKNYFVKNRSKIVRYCWTF